MLVSEDAP
jgi:hypothetical protein